MQNETQTQTSMDPKLQNGINFLSSIVNPESERYEEEARRLKRQAVHFANAFADAFAEATDDENWFDISRSALTLAQVASQLAQAAAYADIAQTSAVTFNEELGEFVDMTAPWGM